jgi:NAD(P)H dehydrogenase (quinone)
MLEHFDTENYIIQSGLNYVIFRNALYMDVLPLFVGKQVFEAGIFQPAGDGKIAFALRKEMGEGIANVLLDEDFDNKTYRFTGSENYSFYDVANVLSILSGKLVKYTAVEIPALEMLMKKRGMSDLMIKKVIDFNVDIRDGQEETVSIDLENKLGRKPTNLLEGLKTLFNFD